MRHRVVFLDRDGVINRMRRDYVKRWEEFELLPGAVEAIAGITATGREVIVLTNQSAIAQGLVSADIVDGIHMRLEALVADRGGHIRAFLMCPHGRDDGCSCRKPAPGLFFRARDELGVDLAEAVMVGDQAEDVRAARAAGCESILVDATGIEGPFAEAADCTVVPSLAQAAELICAA